MIHRIFSHYFCMTFDSKDFNHIKNQIENSNIYTHYINLDIDKGFQNHSYLKYLKYKSYLLNKIANNTTDFKYIKSNLSTSEKNEVLKYENFCHEEEYYYICSKYTNAVDSTYIEYEVRIKIGEVKCVLS